MVVQAIFRRAKRTPLRLDDLQILQIVTIDTGNVLYGVPGFFNQISEWRCFISKKAGLPPQRFALCAVVGFVVVGFTGLCRVMRNIPATCAITMHANSFAAINTWRFPHLSLGITDSLPFTYVVGPHPPLHVKLVGKRCQPCQVL